MRGNTASAPETRKPLRPRFSAQRVAEDMALKGWNNADLARASGLSEQTISRFMRNIGQTARVAERIARALGYTVKRYFSHVEAA